jgi:pimeloyl-ACP methyl ester carboxylesterase
MKSLVLIPSQLCTAAVWEHQINTLSGEVDVCVAGLGSSDSVQDLARHILGGAPGTFSLAAHGMGGFIAFEMWRQAPARIERMALIGTLATADSEAQIARRELYAKLVRDGNFAQVIEERLPILFSARNRMNERLLATARGMAQATGADAFLRQQRAIIGRPDSRPTLATITCPTLVVLGGEDRITAISDAQAIASVIRGARMEVVQDSGHMVPLEQPARTSALLRQWLDL